MSKLMRCDDCVFRLRTAVASLAALEREILRLSPRAPDTVEARVNQLPDFVFKGLTKTLDTFKDAVLEELFGDAAKEKVKDFIDSLTEDRISEETLNTWEKIQQEAWHFVLVSPLLTGSVCLPQDSRRVIDPCGRRRRVPAGTTGGGDF